MTTNQYIADVVRDIEILHTAMADTTSRLRAALHSGEVPIDSFYREVVVMRAASQQFHDLTDGMSEQCFPLKTDFLIIDILDYLDKAKGPVAQTQVVAEVCKTWGAEERITAMIAAKYLIRHGDCLTITDTGRAVINSGPQHHTVLRGVRFVLTGSDSPAT